MRRRELLLRFCGTLTVVRAVNAQQKAMPVIGWLGGASAQAAPNLVAFRHGLSETGYVEGHNVTIEYRWTEGRPDRASALAADLVSRNVDMIVATGDAAAKAATSTIPIVFFSGGDPVATGLVATLARPGGNLTGVSVMVVELMAKRFELLTETVPQARVIGLLLNSNDPNAERFIKEVQDAARTRSLALQILQVNNDSEI